TLETSCRSPETNPHYLRKRFIQVPFLAASSLIVGLSSLGISTFTSFRGELKMDYLEKHMAISESKINSELASIFKNQVVQKSMLDAHEHKINMLFQNISSLSTEMRLNQIRSSLIRHF